MGRRYTEQQLIELKKLITDPEEFDIILDSDDPVRWGEKHFFDPDTGEEPLKVKECFYPILRSRGKDRALRSGRQLGKCESEFTRITMADGSWPTAGELFSKYGYTGESFNIVTTDNETFKHKITKAFIKDNGVKPLIRITTKSGHITTNTDNHPYLVWGNNEKPEWIPANELKSGDRIAITRDLSIIDISQNESSLKADEAELLGYLTGDGGTTQHTIKFTTADLELKDRINTILENLNSNMVLVKSGLYDYNFVIKDRTLFKAGPGNTSWITDFIRKHELAGILAKHKKVPTSVFTSDNTTISIFLGAYWSTDGWICKKGSGTEIGIGSSSRELLEGVRTLLLRLGIVSRIYSKKVKYNNKKHDAWQLTIEDSRSIFQF
jgi:replicative DNA helicase